MTILSISCESYYFLVLLQASHCPYPKDYLRQQFESPPTAPPYWTLFLNELTSKLEPSLLISS